MTGEQEVPAEWLDGNWRTYFKVAHSCGWQVGAGCWRGAQPGLWATATGPLQVIPPRCLGLPHNMAARFSE